MFVPHRAQFDLPESKKQRNNYKLYVQRISTVDGRDEPVPDWLNFVKGVVDSEDLPLNISRETLQQYKIIRVIKKNLMEKCLEMFAEIARKRTTTINYISNLVSTSKRCVHEDSTNRIKIAELSNTTFTTSLVKVLLPFCRVPSSRAFERTSSKCFTELTQSMSTEYIN